MQLGLDQTLFDRRVRVARGLVRRRLGRPANGQLWADYERMLADSRAAPIEHQPGRFWEALQEAMSRELADETLNTFKRTVNSRFSGFTPGEGIYFEYTVRDAYRRLAERDRFGLLPDLDEPALGGPHTVDIDGRAVGVDLLLSVAELYAMADGYTDLKGLGAVLEVGSGYGRVADLVHRVTQGGSCYCLADLPLPLALAQNYLRARWPHARTLGYGQARARGGLTAEDLMDFDFVFLAPWELELLDEDACGIAVNINSFQEMTREQVGWYVGQFARIASRRIFLKEWFTFDNTEDGIRIAPEDMVPGEGWERQWFRPSFPFPMWEEMLFTAPGG